MIFKKLILLGIVIGGVAISPAATMLERDGEIDTQCCLFAALSINWTMDTEWTGVKIEMDFHNGGDEDDIRTAVVLLMNSIGPGTTPANKIDDIVLVEAGVQQKTITLFQGLTLGPGTYHLVYYRVSYEFPYLLSVAWDTSAHGVTTGPGITMLPTLMQDEEAPYRPASTWNPLVGHPNIFKITGTQSEDAAVPEPSTASLLLLGAAMVLPIRRHLRKR